MACLVPSDKLRDNFKLWLRQHLVKYVKPKFSLSNLFKKIDKWLEKFSVCVKNFFTSNNCGKNTKGTIFFPFVFISWRLITLQYYSGFCHTLTWISHGFACVPHPDPPSCLPPHPIPLGLPSAPALSTCLMHPAWAGDLFHAR